MWSPPDKNALPSPEEIKIQKEAVEALQDALKGGGSMQRTRLRLAEIERELEERKAWIAPIRKVPMEVLADILLRASEMDDLAPMAFTAVCRLWRAIILATPRAWSFIDLRSHYNRHLRLENEKRSRGYFPGYKSTYFERSKPKLLHLRIPEMISFHSRHSIPIIKDHAHRIQCLTTSTQVLIDTQSTEICERFPQLRTLYLTKLGRGGHLHISFFNVWRFPVLQNLHWPRCYRLTMARPPILASTFPPLQHLSLEIEGCPLWLELLQSCAATLKMLRICAPYPNGKAAITINFPLLQSLAITSGPTVTKPYIKAKTPALTSLIIDSTSRSIPTFFEIETHTVTHIRWLGFKVPSPCAGVIFLQIEIVGVLYSSAVDCEESAKQIQEIISAYPSLREIEICNGERGDPLGWCLVRQRVEEYFSRDGIKPKLTWSNEWKAGLPGYATMFCEANMPCSPLR